MARPLLGITMGDPCGVGPEITVKALNRAEIYENCRPVVVGSAGVVEQAIKITGLNLSVNAIREPSEGKYVFGTIDVVDHDIVDMDKLVRGRVSVMGGEAAFRAIERVIELAMQDKVDATITGPLNKEALNLAGHHYSGHTEIYAEKTGTKSYCMMLADGDLRVVHISTHVSLRDACDRVKKARELEVIKLADNVCKSMGMEHPRIAVAGLNPHAGENGLFGREEIEEIRPAVEEAISEGINADGPLPPDSVFSKARGGMYDIVVAQYHDQGHIPLKVIGFQFDRSSQKWKSVTGVNITLGLPIIRSSVDHGTAFDQAGKGTANEESMVNAINYGIRLANDRLKKKLEH